MNTVSFFSDTLPFLDKTLEALSTNETRNNLILGLALRLRDDPHAYTKQNPLIAIVSDEQEKIGAMAIMTPPFPMIVHSDPVNQLALESLADALVLSDWHLSGVNGVTDASDAFAQIWGKKTGQAITLHKSMRAYELRKVEVLDYPVGEMRIAEEKDAQIASDMLTAMQQELNLEPSNTTTLQSSQNSIRLNRTFLWVVDGEITSIAIAVRPQIRGICVSGVYTPPEHRCKGYARALVAEVSKELLSRGYELINLFTDLSNPTSNKIYQEVGYQPVCDYHLYSFEWAFLKFISSTEKTRA